MKHLLLTIDVPPYGSLHGYLMTVNDRRDIEIASDKMLNVAKKEMGIDPLPIILCTDLDEEGKTIVRDIVTEVSQEAAELFKKADHFHFTAFYVSSKSNDHKKLMDLH